LGNFLSPFIKDFEILRGTAENMVRIAMMKIAFAKCVQCFARQLLSQSSKAPD
jgi:hypothetical protein